MSDYNWRAKARIPVDSRALRAPIGRHGGPPWGSILG